MKRTFCVVMCKFLAAALFLCLTAAAWAQTESILHSFTGGSDGGDPTGGVVLDAKGNLYGTTSDGGANSAGTVFEFSRNADGSWTETILHSFNFSGDCAFPTSNLVFDASGNLYGSAIFGPDGGFGAIFELSPGSNGTWTEKILYNFAGGSDGSASYNTGLAADGAGNIYGTTEGGGTYGFGTVYQLVPSSSGTWTKNILHSFANLNDGGEPYGETLALDAAGNVYGETLQGGVYDYGTIFELVHGQNGGWNEKILHAFTGGADGSGPEGGVALDASGNLYATSNYSVFQLVPTASGPWTENILHTFTGGGDGSSPDSLLTFDKAGNLYGTTIAGGAHRGTVFELLRHDNGTWTEKILHKFNPSAGDGQNPFEAGLAIDGSGNLYGTTSTGGSSGAGVVFEVTP